MASVSSRAKHFSQPPGGFLGIVKFEQEDGHAGFFDKRGIDDFGINFDNFVQKSLKKNPFPEPYNTYEKSLKLLKKTIMYLVFLEELFDPGELFEEALKGAANIGDSENAMRLFERVNNSDKNFADFWQDTYKPENDIFDDRMMETVCDLASYEYYSNGRYNGVHLPIHISDDLATYLFEIAHSIINTCIHNRKNRPYTNSNIIFPSLLPAYTKTVNSGDIDLITIKTVWKIFLSGDKKPKPSTPETLEVLMQYIMAVKAEPSLNNTLEYLGIYDPNRNLVYTLKISDIPQDIIDTVSTDVIGY